MRTKKKKTSITLTPEAERLLEELSKKLGVNQTALIEMAIRVLAEKEKVR